MNLANNHQIMGRFGKDPELNYFPDGTAYCKFSIGCDESYTNKAGERVPKTSWHNVTAIRHAETIKKYFSKGSLIILSGPSYTKSFDSKDGVKKYSTAIELQNFKFMSPNNNTEKTKSDLSKNDETESVIPDDFPTHTLGYEMGMDTSYTVNDVPF